MIKATAYGLTDVGSVRTNNEDAFHTHISPDGHIVIACAIDGLGGYEGGEVAAGLAERTVAELCDNTPDPDVKMAVVQANNTIYDAARQTPNLSEMGCVMTLIAANIPERIFTMAHVGDSRLYQYEKGRFTKLSHDHSVVGYREEQGDLTEEQAMHHPQRNIISRMVGGDPLTYDTDYVECATFPIIPGSTLLLCSDGLCDMITSRSMMEVLGNDTLNIEERCAELVKRAIDAGGRDNVTVVLVDFSEDPDAITIIDLPESETNDDNIDSTAEPQEETEPSEEETPSDNPAEEKIDDVATVDEPEVNDNESTQVNDDESTQIDESANDEADQLTEPEKPSLYDVINEHSPDFLPTLFAVIMTFIVMNFILLFIYILP